MARTVEQCNQYIVDNLVIKFASVGITITPTSWSTRNLLRLICYSVSIAMSYFEQLMDVYLVKIQDIQDRSAAGSVSWLQNRGFKFQYSATAPQYVTVVDGVAEYPIINETLRIVTACSVNVVGACLVNIKAAKGATTLGALSALEVTALQEYYDTIGAAGVVYNITSQAPDRLYIEGEIYYKSSYSSVISANVIAAIDAYLFNLSHERFGGDILLSDIKKLIRSVDGVNDVSLENVECRTWAQAVGSGTDLVLSYDEVLRKYVMNSGYIIQEDTVLNTFADTLTFTAE